MSNDTVERIEVIGPGGRMFIAYVEPGIVTSYQDNDRTLKIFVGEVLTSLEAKKRWMVGHE